MEISPKNLDLGKVDPGENCTRSIVLKEAATDRFSIVGIESDLEGFSWTVDTIVTSEGLNNYLIQTNIEIPDKIKKIAKQSGEITIKTDSEFFPKVTLPISFEVTADISAVPSVVSFGTVSAGEQASAKVAFITRDGSPITPSFVNLPNGVAVAVDKDCSVLTFTPSEEDKGVFEESLEVEAIVNKKSERLSLKCSALVL